MKRTIYLMWTLLFAAGLAVVSLAGCSDANGENVPQEMPREVAPKPSDEFAGYWYQGVAELNRFELQQARYGEVREGDAVLIFVTEDFLADEQVKLESAKDGRTAPSILKLNFAKKFITGLYPYSMMTSVFTPVDRTIWPHTLKVTSSSQEWCGHTFTQLNRRNDAYRLRQFSYFEKEGDVDREIKPDLLEDEVWTRLRLDPSSLPTGTVSILPGTMVSRLQHTDNTPVTATAKRESIGVDSQGKKMMRYTLEYIVPARVLMIDYRADFPHEIISWSETYDDFGKKLTTKATRTNVIRSKYWSQHAVKDTILRKELGLE